MRVSAKATAFILTHSLSEIAEAVNGGSPLVYPFPQPDIEEEPTTEAIGVVDDFHFVSDGKGIRNEGPITIRFIRSQEVEGLYFRIKLKDDLGVMDGTIGATWCDDLRLSSPIPPVEQGWSVIIPTWTLERSG